MEADISRRELLGGIFVLGGLIVGTHRGLKTSEVAAPVATNTVPLRILHLSDIHWGYQGDWNRHVEETFDRILTRVQALSPAPDLVLVTGDLIEATADTDVRAKRLSAVKDRLDALTIPWLAIPGEHDTFGDHGALFSRIIGPLHFHRTFHGVHIVGLDNVSQGFFIGRRQMEWLAHETTRLSLEDPVLVLTHAPLYNVFIPWNWYTYDGAKVFQTFSRFARRQFLFGHIHQAVNHLHQDSMNRSGLPTSWPFPTPDPLERLSSWPQGATHPDMGLGFRLLDVTTSRFQSDIIYLDALPDKVVQA